MELTLIRVFSLTINDVMQREIVLSGRSLQCDCVNTHISFCQRPFCLAVGSIRWVTTKPPPACLPACIHSLISSCRHQHGNDAADLSGDDCLRSRWDFTELIAAFFCLRFEHLHGRDVRWRCDSVQIPNFLEDNKTYYLLSCGAHVCVLHT